MQKFDPFQSNYRSFEKSVHILKTWKFRTCYEHFTLSNQKVKNQKAACFVCYRPRYYIYICTLNEEHGNRLQEQAIDRDPI